MATQCRHRNVVDNEECFDCAGFGHISVFFRLLGFLSVVKFSDVLIQI
ncbi:MAG: hypothetical protein ACK40X_10530 [Armatimonadota bacterium]